MLQASGVSKWGNESSQECRDVWPRAQPLAAWLKWERASLSSPQKKSYLLLLWKLLARRLVILNKQDGLNTKQEFSMHC